MPNGIVILYSPTKLPKGQYHCQKQYNAPQVHITRRESGEYN